MGNRNKYNLLTANFNPTPMQFGEFTPAKASIDSFSRALSRMEERKRKADEKSSAMDVAFGEFRSKLHNDKETLKWFDDRVKEYKSQVDGYAQIGDYGNAIRSATLLAGQAAKDGEIMDRIKANSEYQQALDKLKTRVGKDISQQTYNYFKDNFFKYSYNEIKDEDGNVIGGSLGTNLDKQPVADISWENLVNLAFKLKTPNKYSNKYGYAIDNKTGDKVYSAVGTNKDGSTNYVGTDPYSAQGKQSQNTLEGEVTFADITANLNALMGDPERLEQLNQAFEVSKYSFEQLREQLEDYKSHDASFYGLTETEYNDKVKNLQQRYDFESKYMMLNNSEIDFKNYVANKVYQNQFAKSLAYRHFNTMNIYDYGYNVAKASGSGGDGGNGYHIHEDNYKSSNVDMQQDDTHATANKTATKVSNIANGFEN